jgi:serine/threonine protein kinase
LKAETVDLQVAIKEFLRIEDFIKENDILQQLKGLQHPHIIRHFVSIHKGKKGYIIFPWADGGSLQEFWENSMYASSRERTLWSIQQMLGLTTALHLLHQHFECRHGDLKPGNILCFKNDGETVLKIADFGLSKIHHAQTMYRKSATTTLSLTPSYQAPEVEFEKVDEKNQSPRSRRFDIWSLGCVFLEFSIWLLHGPETIKKFAGARGTGRSSTDGSRPLYQVTDKATKAAKVHQLVIWTIKCLQDDPRCKGDTALAALLNLIKDHMLQPEVKKRYWAADVGKELEEIIWKAKERDSYLFNSCDNLDIPSPNFEHFQSVQD